MCQGFYSRGEEGLRHDQRVWPHDIRLQRPIWGCPVGDRASRYEPQPSGSVLLRWPTSSLPRKNRAHPAAGQRSAGMELVLRGLRAHVPRYVLELSPAFLAAIGAYSYICFMQWWPGLRVSLRKNPTGRACWMSWKRRWTPSTAANSSMTACPSRQMRSNVSTSRHFGAM